MHCADLDNLLIEDDGVVPVGEQFVQHLSLLWLKQQNVQLVVLPSLTLQQGQQQVQTFKNLKKTNKKGIKRQMNTQESEGRKISSHIQMYTV